MKLAYNRRPGRRHGAVLMLIALMVPVLSGCDLFDSTHGLVVQHGWDTLYVVNWPTTSLLIQAVQHVPQQKVANTVGDQFDAAPWYVRAIAPGFGGWTRGHAQDLHNALHLSAEQPISCLQAEMSPAYNYGSGFDGCLGLPGGSGGGGVGGGFGGGGGGGW